MIEIKNLRKVYADGTAALNGASVKFDKRVTAVLGRNGAGKTTMIRIFSTQLMPTSGSAAIDGHDAVSEAGIVRENILSIPQDAKPQRISTPMEHCIMYLTARGMSTKDARAAATHAMKKVGLFDTRNTPCDELFGGMKQKVFVAMLLASSANVIFLDEPTTCLDPYQDLKPGLQSGSLNIFMCEK